MVSRLAAAAALAVSLVFTPLGVQAMPQPQRPAADPGVECAWWVETSTTKSNILYPDTAAAYWTMAYDSSVVEEILISGTYLDTRYFALQVYGADAQLFTVDGAESAIADYQIEPDAGSVNPYQQDASPGGAWSVTLSNDAATAATNLLPLAPATAVTPLLPGTPATTVYMMIRAYLPADGFSALRGELPQVTITERGGISRTLSPCTGKQRKALAALKDVKSLKAALETREDPPSADCGDSCPPDLQFFKVGSVSTPFPNANSAYVGALYTPQQGKIVVMRALMPTTSSGTSPQVWPGGKDLRYWSICNYVHKAPYPAVETVIGGKGSKVFGCTNDNTTALTKGVATIVVSLPADKKAIAKRLKKIPGTTWLPMSPKYGQTQELLAVRNMLPNPSFIQSATNISTTGDPAAALDVMGKYYPEVGMCSVKTFLKSGAAGCLASND